MSHIQKSNRAIQKSKITIQNSEIKIQNSEIKFQNSEINIQNSEINIQNSNVTHDLEASGFHAITQTRTQMSHTQNEWLSATHKYSNMC